MVTIKQFYGGDSMSLRMFTMVALQVGLTMTAQAEPRPFTKWLPAGQTDARCSFNARLDILSGYPFARIVIQDGDATRVIPMAERERQKCDFLSYSQVPEPSFPPTYEVSVSSLCMSRLPRYKATRSLSGVQETCTFEK